MSSTHEPFASERRVKILIVTRNLPPLVGGMEKLNWHMANELTRYADVTIIGPPEAATSMPHEAGFQRVPLRPLWWFLLAATWKAIRISRKIKADVVLAGSGLTAPAALIASRISGGKSMVYVHGLDVAVRHPLYRALWHPCIRLIDGVIANSAPTRSLCLQLGIDAADISIVHPGVTLPADYREYEQAVVRFKQEHGLVGKKILLSVGRLTTRKGLREFVQNSLPAIITEEPNTVLLIIGDAPADSLYAEGQSVESIKAVARNYNVEKNLIFTGVITSDHQLSTAYYASDVHVFPVRTIQGDPEGFGMVAIEAASHGVPTVAFSTGGIVDAVRSGVSGYIVENENYEALSEHIVCALREPMNEKAVVDFAVEFQWNRFGEKIAHAVNENIKAIR